MTVFTIADGRRNELDGLELPLVKSNNPADYLLLSKYTAEQIQLIKEMVYEAEAISEEDLYIALMFFS